MSSPDDLLKAFYDKKSRKFQECLEVYSDKYQNVVCKELKNRTVFETILSTPNSSEFIEICIEHNAEFHMVSFTFCSLSI